jgi:hypothetical protein
MPLVLLPTYVANFIRVSLFQYVLADSRTSDKWLTYKW